MSSLNKKVCVIGAGASGIVSCKTLLEQGVAFDCYEKGSYIGGLWKYENDNGQSSAYRSLHINTSRQMMAYSDFPMPESYPDYPHHSLIYRYFGDYVDHFGFRDKIQFNTEVKDISPLPGNRYLVATSKGKKEYDAVMVCNGHHWNPKFPSFPGKFSGKTLHSHFYKTFEGFEGNRVLIVGIGNSAVDIACELCKVASRTVISTRSGAYILPKYFFGIPADHLAGPPLPFLPIALQRAVLGAVLYISSGDQSKYGIPKPKRKLLQEHPTVSQELPSLVGHGKITIKPNIAELMGDTVLFQDGSSEDFDIIIYATGYNIRFPFLKDEVVSVIDNVFPLYKKVVHPEWQNLFFIGLIQPLGPVMPLAELQASWVVKLIKGEVALPDKKFMLREIDSDRREMIKRYGTSSRHTLQVDFYPYQRLLIDEISGKKSSKGIFA
jgi:dimethylaniline monooxygenase (N-oxide forming)